MAKAPVRCTLGPRGRVHAASRSLPEPGRAFLSKRGDPLLGIRQFEAADVPGGVGQVRLLGAGSFVGVNQTFGLSQSLGSGDLAGEEQTCQSGTVSGDNEMNGP